MAVADMIHSLLTTSYAPHGYCLLWQPSLIWIHAVSDTIIAVSYFSIPLALVAFVHKRRDIAFGGIFWMFALFILACGTTHILSIWNLWHGNYGVEALVKLVTAAASLVTAVLLWPLLPKAIALPSPARLREANDALSVRIVERDAAVAALHAEIVEREKAEAALLQSRKMEAIGQLTGGIAHDFNNLLQIISGSLDLMSGRANDDPRLLRLTSNAIGAVRRGKRLTSQLLAFSRLQRLEIRAIDVPAMIEEMRDLLARSIDPSISLTVTCEEQPYKVQADRVQLELALLNLTLNARDAMPNGGKLTISVRNRHLAGQEGVEDGEYLAIAVTDNGIGMSPEIAQRVFEPFFTTKPIGAGSGLGLSMVFGMTRQSGGTVMLDSMLGSGTTVTIYLRRAEAQQSSNEADHAIAPLDVEKLAGLTMLVVDDEPDVRDVIATIVRDFGCSVLQARDGQHALQLIEQHRPRLMIVDFAMPGMNGADVARMALARQPGIKVVFATGFSQSDAIAEVMGEDAIILRKPFTAGDLAHALARAIERKDA
jgi:signal transduction histidine kinase